MRRFLYFLPGATGTNPTDLAKRGLLDRFQGAGGEMMEHVIGYGDTGPAGSGVFVAIGPNPPQYDPDRQRWIEGPTFWAGIEENALVPRPEDLTRGIRVSGYEVTAPNGTAWRAPVIRRGVWRGRIFEHEPNVPTTARSFIEGGKRKFEKTVDPAYAKADAIAGRMWDLFCLSETAETQTIQFTQLADDAAALLGINYRIGVEEADLLGILDEEFLLNVIQASFDKQGIVAEFEDMRANGLELAEPIPFGE